MSEPRDNWVVNYFNYFTEVEEYFRKVRGTGLFLLSPLDWALIASWKEAEVPLEAVLRGIDVAFEKWRLRQIKTQKVNSLAFCAQAVLMEAQLLAGTKRPAAGKESAPPFGIEELRVYLARNAEALRGAYPDIAAVLLRLETEIHTHYRDLEQLEQRLTALEDRLLASARTARTDEELLAARRELDAELRPYRGKMSAEQLTMLEKQFLDRKLLQSAGLPRLSLFYLK